MAAYFTVIKQAGIVWFGPPIDVVFGTIAPEFFIDSIQADLHDWKTNINENPDYVILNFCRSVAYIKTNHILSKEQGGEWALKNLPYQYHDVIKIALENYHTNRLNPQDKAQAMTFCQYMWNYFSEYLGRFWSATRVDPANL